MLISLLILPIKDILSFFSSLTMITMNKLKDPDSPPQETSASLYQLLKERVFSRPDLYKINPTGIYKEGVQLPAGILLVQILQQQNSILAIMPTEVELQNLYSDIQALGLSALIFPDWGSAPYRGIRSQTKIFVERSQVLARISHWFSQDLSSQEPLIVLTTLRALAPVLPQKEYFVNLMRKLQVNDSWEPSQLAHLLSSLGYYQVPRVTLRGEYALRGEVVDFYPPSVILEQEDSTPLNFEECAVRVMFSFDEIESIKLFDTSSQMSRAMISHIILYPLREILWGECEVQHLRMHFDQVFESAAQEDFDYTAEQGGLGEQSGHWQTTWLREQEQAESLLESLENGLEVVGEELFFPLACENCTSLAGYMGKNTQLIFWGIQRIEQQREALQLELETLYQKNIAASNQKKYRQDTSKDHLISVPNLIQRKLLQPKQYAVDLHTIQKEYTKILSLDEFQGEIWPIVFESSLPYHGNLYRFQEDLQNWIQSDYTIAICAVSTAQVQRIKHILKEFSSNLLFFPQELQQGVCFPKEKLILIQEWEILGNRAKTRGYNSRSRDIRKNNDKEEQVSARLSHTEIINSFVELKEKDLVVHVQHGIGRFKGIERINTARMERDYLVIEYADDNTLFVPIEQVNMVQRYIGSESPSIRLDRIGGKAWQERKAKTRKAVDDLADRLFRLYVKRIEIESFRFPPDEELQEEFEADFPYEATVDQLRAIAEIKEDLESSRPMDRLLCGDVGFGKTEVAMRACFKVVSSGKQVILLCPTTILAEQHHQNFVKRFHRFPIRIVMLSRFVEISQQRLVLQSLEKGEVDILIGTHRILAQDIHLKNLGLVVIDEEQRFGVKHKERLKLLKTSVDSLTMSATPIPRTLHMSLVQIRDISMLSTAPRNRHPVETFVREFNSSTIAEAIRYEIERNGQVFYLHNRVEDLEEILSFLRGLVPEALVEMAHGQMESKALEDIMYRFVHGSFHVLLATTIIENGIDIPNVNTIIIDRADRYGIAQLYQLRGRVGRSDQLAYAYLFYPDRSSLSELAMKRLSIISDFTELGSGFKVAMKDLEVRGAGNLLGPEQSGNILSVGFEMYANMLSQAMAERKTGQNSGEPGSVDHEPEIPAEEISLELDYSGFIPDHYVREATEKIHIYKRISSIDQSDDLDKLYEELSDRFGAPPAEVRALLSLAEIRIICRKVGISYLKERRGEVELRFSRAHALPVEKIMQQIQTYPDIFRLDSQKPDALFIQLERFMQGRQAPQDYNSVSPKSQSKSHGSHSKNAQQAKVSKSADKAPGAPSTNSIAGAKALEKDLSALLVQKVEVLRNLLSSFYS